MFERNGKFVQTDDKSTEIHEHKTKFKWMALITEWYSNLGHAMSTINWIKCWMLRCGKLECPWNCENCHMPRYHFLRSYWHWWYVSDSVILNFLITMLSRLMLIQNISIEWMRAIRYLLLVSSRTYSNTVSYFYTWYSK